MKIFVTALKKFSAPTVGFLTVIKPAGLAPLLMLLLAMAIAENGFGQSAASNGAKDNTVNISGKKVVLGKRSIADNCWKKGGRFEKYTVNDEILEKRDLNSKHFANPDGSITAFISEAPLHYQDAIGAWNDIRTDIRPNLAGNNGLYKYSIPENKFESYFANDLKSGYVLKINGGNILLSKENEVLLLDANGNVLETALSNGETTGAVSDNKLVFKNTYPFADDEIIANGNGIEHDIVLNQKPAFFNTHNNAATLAFREFIQLPDGWQIVSKRDAKCISCGDNAQNDRGLAVLDEKGNLIVEFLTPVFREKNIRQIPHDNDPIKGPHVEQKVVRASGDYKIEKANGGYYVETLAPVAWLNDNDRQYPVIIDPSTTCYPSATTWWTGYATGSNNCTNGNVNNGDLIQWEGVNYAPFVGWAYLNVSSLTGATSISSVVYGMDINGYYCPFWYTVPMGAFTSTCATLWSRANSIGSPYYTYNTCIGGNGYLSYTLGGTANADVLSDIAGGSFGVGFYDYDASTTTGYYGDAYGWYNGNSFAPYITVTYTSCTSPATQASVLSTSSVASTTATVSIGTRGNGTGGVIIVAYPGASAGAAPTSGTSYTANVNYTSGTPVGTGYTVYNGNAAAPINVNVTGLTASTQYTFVAYEYASTGTCYLTTTTGNTTTTTACSPSGAFGTSPWTVPSSGCYSVPSGVTSITVECWGGGGGGGGCGNGSSTSSNGGSGGGGAYSRQVLTVNSTQSYSITIGGQGSAGGASAAGGTGGSSIFTGPAGTCSADGGGGGGGAANNNSGSAGGAGSTGSGVLYSGGSGSVGGGGSTYSCSVGGGGAGNAGNGTNGALCSGGGGGAGGTGGGTLSTAGGSGGGNATSCASNSTNHDGDAGTGPGGGGGGGYHYTTSGSNNGGLGGLGRVIITYVSCTAPTINTQPTNPTTTCIGTGTSFTVAATGTSPTYQWQISNNGGTSYVNLTNAGVYSGATSATLSISNPQYWMNNYKYQCVVSSGTCSTTTTAAVLTVSYPGVTNTAPTNPGSSTYTINGTN